MGPKIHKDLTLKVGKCNVTVALGDMTKQESDAYIVPQFLRCASLAGVGLAVANGGAERGCWNTIELRNESKNLN